MAEEQTHIKVILRIRPPNKQELGWFKSGEYAPILRDESKTEDPEHRIVVDHSGKTYNYNKVFRENCTQKALFTEAAVPTLENVFKGYCGAVMAYGQTGTGKSHTMQGYDKSADGDERGIIPRCADYIFRRVAKESSTTTITVTMNFVQIYLDKLQDLFVPDAPEVNINPDTERVELPGITEKTITSAEEFMKMFYMGEAHRVTRATLMNPTSSRGHAALIANIRMVPMDVSQSTRVGKLVLVDLAGYERFSATGITSGIAAEEAKKINASLLALGSVVNALAEKQKHVPYRNAKLTRLLKDCLGGTSKSTIILTMNNCDKYKQETAGTLFFGFQAMSVKVDARIREEFDPAKYIITLKEKMQEGQKIISQLVKVLKSIPGGYEKYVEKHGELPNIEISTEDEDDEQTEIVNAMLRQPSRRMSRAATMAQLKAAEMGIPPPENFVAMDSEQLLSADLIDNPDAPEEVRAVQQTWNQELRAHQDQMAKQLETLRLRHIQDLEEARLSGVSEDVLLRLREEHEEELRMMREQNQVLKEEILRQKEKEEAKALLSSASHTLVAVETHPGQAGGVSEEMRSDNVRVKEMVEHLQETCENKDEVLRRMFDLICLREAQIKDLEENAQAIAIAQLEDSGQGSNQAMDKAKTEIARYRQENTTLRAENERLKKMVGSSIGSASSVTSSIGSIGSVGAPRGLVQPTSSPVNPARSLSPTNQFQPQQQSPRSPTSPAAYPSSPARGPVNPPPAAVPARGQPPSAYGAPATAPRGLQAAQPASPTRPGTASPTGVRSAPSAYGTPSGYGGAVPQQAQQARGFAPQNPPGQYGAAPPRGYAAPSAYGQPQQPGYGAQQYRGPTAYR